MLLSLVVHTYSLRYWFPATIMLGTAPAYILSWGVWRMLSTVLPASIYHKIDDRIYCIYQSMVLFFFENYTGVEHGGIYVKRSAKFNEKAMRKKLLNQTQTGTPMYLVIFPEGTRYNPEIKSVIADSQAFAKKQGLAVLKHTLTPRMKAAHVAIETMKDHLDAVYDVTVAYEGTLDGSSQRRTAPSMPEFLCKECPRVHIHFDRVDINEIPPEPEFFRRWLHERFEIKDRLLTDFYESQNVEKKNSFPGEAKVSPLRLYRTLPSVMILGGLTLPMLLTENGRKFYVRTWVCGTLLGWMWVNLCP
ncbi:1-acyl-sn-glycerol-3-phosphate acyltransferase epsilon [Oryzias melastigma]|uniref:1-acyl-sn-glycerol-3-phosphate acyltransferase epsilon n=1 Tax=Oryzias melastigma TaxID=30732 RepID=A0A834CN65_ORYME|nr:1-acyl-sn-glycerol-3-phosphate acyltransferase epsilon [Oryzias melastigma]